MIKIEHEEFPSPEEMIFVIEGMRNAHNSWKLSDSGLGCCDEGNVYFCDDCTSTEGCYWGLILGENDKALMTKLAESGTDHRKFMRAMQVMVRLTAPLYFWKEFDTYKIGTVSLSCSTMHKIADKEFTVDDFSHEHLYFTEEELNAFEGCRTMDKIVELLNKARAGYLETGSKDWWWQIIQILPSSYNQTRNICMNYEVLRNMYCARKTHKLDEWREFCKWMETIPYSFLITGKE